MRGNTTSTLLAIGVLSLATLVPFMPLSVLAGLMLLCYLPGRLALPLIGIDQDWSRTGRILVSLALSWSIVPFCLNPIWHQTNDRFALLAFVWVMLSALACFSCARERKVDASDPPPFFELKSTRRFAVLLGIFVAGAVALPYWPTELFGYPVPAKIHDFIKHHAIITSMELRPLPIGNVFFAAGAAEPVYYYHYFYLIPATIRAWCDFSISHEAVFGLSSLSVAFSVVTMVYVLAKRFTGSERSATLSVCLVTIVGSFDMYLYLPTMFQVGKPLAMIDHWTEHPYIIHNLMFQLIWSPQNVLGLLIVLVGVYVLSRQTLKAGWLILGPLLGQSVLGSSVWVAVGTLPALAIWALTKWRQIAWIAVVGVIMLLVSGPLILNYTAGAQYHDRQLTAEWPHNPCSIWTRYMPPGPVANFVELPVTLIVEFGAKAGLLLFVPLVFWSRMWKDEGLRWLFIASLTALILCSIVRVELRHNDLKQKCVMSTLVFTAIMAGACVGAKPTRFRWYNPLGWAPRHRPLATAIGVVIALFVAPGLISELYEGSVTVIRRYAHELLISRRIEDPRERQLMYDERPAVDYLKWEIPDDAVIQCAGAGTRADLAQVVRKQIGIMDLWDDVAVFAPQDLTDYLECHEEVFGELRSGSSAKAAYEAMRNNLITHLLLAYDEIHYERWLYLERFEDSRYFETLFQQGEVRVLKLRPDAAVDPES